MKLKIDTTGDVVSKVSIEMGSRRYIEFTFAIEEDWVTVRGRHPDDSHEWKDDSTFDELERRLRP